MSVTVPIAHYLRPNRRHRCSRLSLLILFGVAGTAPGCRVNIGAPEAADSVSRLAPQLPDINILTGDIRVQIKSRLVLSAAARVTMRVNGERVYFTSRSIPAGAEEIFAGPDRADTVLVEVESAGLPGGTPISQTFLLGRDFQSGDTILVELIPPPVDDGSGSTPPPPPPPPSEPPPNIRIEGLDSDTRVNAGGLISFAVVVSGFSADSRVAALADADDAPGSGNEVAIASDLPAGERLSIRWEVPDLAPGAYRVYAEVKDGAAFLRSAPAPGFVRVNAQPRLVLDSPRAGQLVTRGRKFIVGWAGTDADDDASIRIFLDRESSGQLDGDEITLVDGASEDDLDDRSRAVDSSSLAPGEYFVRGRIADPLGARFSTNAIHIGVTSRLVGRFTPDELGEGLTKIVGGAENAALGTSVDCSRDVDGDGLSDVLVSDPLASFNDPESPPIEAEIYYHEQLDGAWPATIAANELALAIRGDHTGTAAGQRVALMASIDGDSTGDILIGAPLFGADGGEGEPAGRAYFLNGRAARTRERIWLETLSHPLGSHITGGEGEALGLDVGALGDLDGDGYPEAALGATRGDGSGGTVYIVAGGALPSGETGQIGSQTRGVAVHWSVSNDLLGFAVRGIEDVNGDGLGEVAIGAPTANYARGDEQDPRRTGVVFVLFGLEGIFEAHPYGLRLADIGSELAGLILVGEQTDDLAGASLASGDFDGDGLVDLLVGAPGFDRGRGRVYLISDLGDPSLPLPLELANVGTTIAGAVFEGAAVGDRFGESIAAAGDFDHDGVSDFMVGAPQSDAARGTALLIYGATDRTGTYSAALIGTFDLPGWELAGPAAGQRAGAAVSGGGLLNRDEFADVMIGGPGRAPGEAYLVFGRGAKE
jgi:hypothetical protein